MSFATCACSSGFRFNVHDVAELRYRRSCARREGSGEQPSCFRILSLPLGCRRYGSPLVSWTAWPHGQDDGLCKRISGWVAS